MSKVCMFAWLYTSLLAIIFFTKNQKYLKQNFESNEEKDTRHPK